MLTNLFKWLLYPPVHVTPQRLNERFADRWVVITGATSGIGKALAERLISAGANVYLIARREEILRQLCADAQRRGVQALYYAADLRDSAALDALLADCHARLPHVDYLFCNAGKSIHRMLVEAQERLHDYDRTMSLNYRSLVAMSLSLYPLLQRAQSGRIIYSSSISTLYPAAPGWSAYHASKAAANVWCQTADAEWSRQGVRVKVAYLPLVHTPMSDVNPAYRGLPGYSADEAASVLLRLSQSQRSCYRPWWAYVSAPLADLLSPLIRYLYRHL